VTHGRYWDLVTKDENERKIYDLGSKICVDFISTSEENHA
jgi:hypothetical protein